MNIQNELYVPKVMQELKPRMLKSVLSAGLPEFLVWDMMAVCWYESMGNFWYDCQNCLMKRRLVELEEVTGLKTWEFLAALRCGKGENAHKLPRFLFDAGAFHFMKSSKLQGEWSKVDLAIASCGIGIATRFVTSFAKNLPRDNAMNCINEFKRNENMQLQRLAHDLNDCMASDTSSSVKTLENFYSDKRQNNSMFRRSKEVAALSARYRAAYEQAPQSTEAAPTELNLNEVGVKTWE